MLKDRGKSSESVQLAMLKACERMRRHGPVIVHCTDSEDFPRPHYRIFIHLDKTRKCDGRTDGQNRCDYYSGRHCGRAVKTEPQQIR